MLDIGFAHPEMVFALVLPLVEHWVAPWFAQKQASRQRPAALPVVFHPYAPVLAELAKHPTPPSRPPRRMALWQHGLWWLGWLLLTLSLMQPEQVRKQVQVTSHGVDMMLAVDVSRSMLALDFSDSRLQQGRADRLTVVKQVVGEFIANRMRHRSGDRYGLILFGGQAYMQAPLSVDGIAVAEMLAITSAGIAGDATAIGDAVGLGVKQLRERPEGSRVLILLTDGANNAGVLDPKDAAELVRKYGVRLYAIGVGSEAKEVPYPMGDAAGNRYIDMVTMPMDEAALKQMAEHAGGRYYRATDPKTLERIYQEIDTLEQSEAESQVRLMADPLYRWLLLPGLLCMMGWLLIRLYAHPRLFAKFPASDTGAAHG